MVAVSVYFIWVHAHPLPPPQPGTPGEEQSEVEEVQEQEQEQNTPANTTVKDDSWNEWHLCIIWIIVLVIGVVAGMVGLGGGILIIPILLELKIHPQTAAATATFMVLFSSTIAAVTFGLADSLNLEYTAVYGPVCLVGGFIGVFVLSGIVKKLHRASLVTTMMAVLIIISAGLVAGFAGREAVEGVIQGVPVTVGNLCT